MAESGCLRDVHAQNIEISGRTNLNGHLSNNYLRFMLRDYSNLTLVASNDAAADNGLTLGNETYNEVAWDGDGAAAVTLPAAKPGSLTVFEFAAQADGGENIVFSCASGDAFAVQTLITQTQNLGDGVLLPAVFGGLDLATPKQNLRNHGAVGSAGATAAEVTTSAGNNTLTIASTATDNQTAQGAELGFYCENDGLWRVSWLGSELGSGVINATFAFSTA
jgi:hypothetical protein